MEKVGIFLFEWDNSLLHGHLINFVPKQKHFSGSGDDLFFTQADSS